MARLFTRRRLVAKSKVKMIGCFRRRKSFRVGREAPVTEVEIDEKIAMLQQTIEWLRGHLPQIKSKHSARIKVLRRP
jgi:uncharacterized small protein (DUF1192 family)